MDKKIVIYLLLVASIVMNVCPGRIYGEEKKELIISNLEGDDALCWKGGESSKKAKEGKYSLEWSNLPSSPSLKCESVPDDWTKYDVLSFWLYSEVANNQGLQLVISSENPESEGIDYYSATIRVTWTGWKKLSFSLSSLGAARSPRGWNQIDNMYFSSNGWGHKSLDDTLLYFDDFKLEKSGAVSTSSVLLNPSFEDKDKDGVPDNWEYVPPGNNQTTFISLITLGNSSVIKIIDNDSKIGVGIGQWVKIAPGHTYSISAYLKGGKISLYLYYHDRNKKEILPQCYRLVKGGDDKFTKQTYTAKAPEDAEWCKVFIYSTTANITEVFMDKIEFEDLGKDYQGPKGLTISDTQFFSLLNLDFPGMENVKVACQKGNLEDAKTAYLNFRRNKSKAKWHINSLDKPNTPASPVYPAAERIMQHFVRIGIYNNMEVFLGEDINWNTNPLNPLDPNYDTQFSHSLHRLPFWNVLGQAYWQTLDEKYAKEWIYQMIDWIKDNPVALDSGPGDGPFAWWTLNPGIRMSGSWMNAYNYFLFSPAFTPDVHCTFVKSATEHGWRLKKITLDYPERSGNWITMECNGLGTIGILFPELKEADEFRKVAFDKLNKELSAQVYPDGAQIELTTGYHQVSRMNFMDLAKLALMNNIPLPEGYIDKLKKMYVFNLYMMDPSGALPPLNDANPADIKSSLMEAYQIWKDEEFLFGATRGKQGRKPKYDSYFFNWAGYYTMRSGWDYLDKYLLFDAGPVGFGHWHEDMLNMYLYAYGRILLTEPGNYSYDQSKWRRYVLSTPGHNTIIVDGKEQRRGDDAESRLIKEPLNNPWISSPFFDYASGTYSSGYQQNVYQATMYFPMGYSGPKDISVSHTRSVIFLKPHYFLAVDFLEGTGEHKYDAHFHLNASDAEVNEKTKAVHTLRADNVQLGLFPMDVKNLEVEIVKGREDPVLGWLPIQKKPIPTVVYSKKEQAPSSFSTLLYPYFRDKPSISYKEVMTQRTDVWARNVSTPYETFTIVLQKDGGRASMKIEQAITPSFVTNSTLTVIRIPKDTKETCFGFYNLSLYKDDNLSFNLSSPVSLLVMKKENGTFAVAKGLYIFNPLEKEFKINFTLPFAKAITFPAQTWMEISSGEAKKVDGGISPYAKKAELLFADSSLISYESYLAKFKDKPKSTLKEIFLLEAEDMTGEDTRFKVSTTKIGAKKSIYMWNFAGQKIEKEINVPESGFYRILLKYCTGGEPARSLFTDREIPFREVSSINFEPTIGKSPSDGWSNKTDDWRFFVLGEDKQKDGFLFYLNKGKHVFTMTNEMGEGEQLSGSSGLNLDCVALFPESMRKEDVIKKMEATK